MNDINKILADYTSGAATLEETNAALAAAGAGFHLDPDRNAISKDERATRGLLDTGTGSLDKVRILDGCRLDHAVNEVQPDGSVNMPAYVIANGRRYAVRGDVLAEVE